MLERDLLIVTGKGGVGRSALAAALGLRAARHGASVLLIGMTDALGLALHLRAETLDYEPRELRPGLHAIAIEPVPALDEYLRIQLRLPRMGPMTRAFHVLAETVPGIRETVIMGKILYEVRRTNWDIVIADGPPIGQVASYLRAPSTIQGLVPSGRVAEQSGWMRETLEDPGRSGLVMATLGEELPVSETLEALDTIAHEGLIDVADLVVNRVLPPPDLSDGDLVRVPEGPHRQAAVLHEGLYRQQRSWIDRLPAATELPYLFGLLTPGEVSARLADIWETR
ncbi:MAG TPA: ArsA-related P-loop ATPase [Acidimicrobiia bacterium]|nr:ArsA-related P-loop ATPase [Acidimicrobiia bacterium]